MQFLVLKSLVFSHVNCHTSFNVQAGPAVTAHVGFAQNLCLKFGSEFKGCAILHQGLHMEAQWVYGKMHTHQIRGTRVDPMGASGKAAGIALSDQPNALGHYKMSMIIAFEANQNSVLLQSAKGMRQELTEWLSRSRLAGGTLVNIGELYDIDFPVCDSLMEALKVMRYEHGFWITDAKDRVSLLQKQGYSQLEAMLELIYDNQNEQKQWHSVSLVGYYLAHAPRNGVVGAKKVQKIGPLNGGEFEVPQHAFAEPLLGLIEYTPKHDVEKKIEDLLWHFTRLQEDENALICTTRKGTGSYMNSLLLDDDEEEFEEL